MIRQSCRGGVPMCAKAQTSRLALVVLLTVSLFLGGCAPRILGLFHRDSDTAAADTCNNQQIIQAQPMVDEPTAPLDQPSLELDPNQKYKWIDYSEWGTGHPILESAGIVALGTAVGAGYVGLVLLYLFAPGPRGACFPLPPSDTIESILFLK
jgi:hypothetical protein